MRITESVKALIIVNVLFFIGTALSENLSFGLFSLFYFENPSFQFWQPFTHMFMHGGLLHIVFNMYALWAFGSPLEMQWGRNRFLFFYFSAGLGAALIHSLVAYYQFHAVYDVLLNAGISVNDITQILQTGSYNTQLLDLVSQSQMQTFYEAYNGQAVGASGAVYGILVAFGMLYPNVELMLLFFPVPIKAKYFIPGLLLLDLFSGVTGFSLFGQNIANWAHIGGALFGFIMAYYWKKNSFNHTRWN